MCPFSSRSVVDQYGLWDQLRVDKGKEWYLMLFMQEKLAHLRFNTNRAPHLQTSSTLVSSEGKRKKTFNGSVIST